ncbi:MAG TPA: hypothetical protein VMC48_06005, partial [Methanobacterium sp.]|nr:hypothetical protein [Methanobacterium sp.]
MKKIYLFSLIITLLAMVVFTSGCTQNGNQTNSSNTTGSYSVNGLTFNYPIEWILVGQTRGNVHLI